MLKIDISASSGGPGSADPSDSDTGSLTEEAGVYLEIDVAENNDFYVSLGNNGSFDSPTPGDGELASGGNGGLVDDDGDEVAGGGGGGSSHVEIDGDYFVLLSGGGGASAAAQSGLTDLAAAGGGGAGDGEGGEAFVGSGSTDDGQDGGSISVADAPQGTGGRDSTSNDGNFSVGDARTGNIWVEDSGKVLVESESDAEFRFGAEYEILSSSIGKNLQLEPGFEEVEVTADIQEIILDDIDFFVRYRESGESEWNETETVTVSTTGDVTETVEGLQEGTEYEFQGVLVKDGNEIDDTDVETDTTGYRLIVSEDLGFVTDFSWVVPQGSYRISSTFKQTFQKTYDSARKENILFSPDDSFILSTTDFQGGFKVFDGETYDEIAHVDDIDDNINGSSIQPDSEHIIINHEDRIHVYETDNFTEVNSFDLPDSASNKIAGGPGNEEFVVETGDGVGLLDIFSDDNPSYEATYDEESDIEDIAADRERDMVAVAYGDKIDLLDGFALSLEETINTSNDTVSVVFDKEGDYIARGGDSSLPIIYSTDDYSEVADLESDSVSGSDLESDNLSFSQNNSFIVSSGNSSRVHVHDAQTWSELEVLEADVGDTLGFYGLDFAYNKNSFILAGSEDEFSDSEAQFEIKSSFTELVMNEFVSSSDFADLTKIFEAWDRVAVLEEAESDVYSIAFDEQGRYMAYCTEDSNLFVHDFESWSLEHVEEDMSGFRNHQVKFSPNGEYLAVAADAGGLIIFSVPEFEEVTVLSEGTNDCRSVDFTEDSSKVIYAEQSEEIFVHEVGGDWPLLDSYDSQESSSLHTISVDDENGYMFHTGGSGDIWRVDFPEFENEELLNDFYNFSRDIEHSTNIDLVAFGGSDDRGTATTYDGEDTIYFSDIPNDENVGYVSFTNRNSFLAFTSEGGEAVVYDIGEVPAGTNFNPWDLRARLDDMDGVLQDIQFSVDDRFVSIGDRSGSVYIYKTMFYEPLAEKMAMQDIFNTEVLKFLLSSESIFTTDNSLFAVERLIADVMSVSDDYSSSAGLERSVFSEIVFDQEVLQRVDFAKTITNSLDIRSSLFRESVYSRFRSEELSLDDSDRLTRLIREFYSEDVLFESFVRDYSLGKLYSTVVSFESSADSSAVFDRQLSAAVFADSDNIINAVFDRRLDEIVHYGADLDSSAEHHRIYTDSHWLLDVTRFRASKLLSESFINAENSFYATLFTEAYTEVAVLDESYDGRAALFRSVDTEFVISLAPDIGFVALYTETLFLDDIDMLYVFTAAKKMYNVQIGYMVKDVMASGASPKTDLSYGSYSIEISYED